MRTFLLTFLALFTLPLAKADEFAFTLQTAACQYQSCATTYNGAGTFTTGALGLDPALPFPYGQSVTGYAITGMSGQLNGNSLSLLSSSLGLIQSNGTLAELFPIFPVLFMSGGTQMTLQPYGNMFMPGVNSGLFSSSSGQMVELNIVAVPEPSTTAFILFAGLGLASLIFFKRRALVRNEL